MKGRFQLIILTIFAFLAQTCVIPQTLHAQEFLLPQPGTRVSLSPAVTPAILKGIKVHPNDPLKFDFILDPGSVIARSEATKQSGQEELKKESQKLIKYFLAALTTPENDLWVNLSPYEQHRIVPVSFGQTEMGRDLLAQDYILKQVTASLIYPEDEIGRKFWKRIYDEAAKRFGTTNVPVNTFNKVWVVPEKAVVYENAAAGTAYVVESKLKVMLEQDYLALNKKSSSPSTVVGDPTAARQWDKLVTPEVSAMGSQVVREVVIPELEKEINQGKNFIQLRQVYNSLILAAWYKKKIKDSILAQVFTDKNKIAGITIDNPQEAQKIYEHYLQAFKKGAYNYIKEEQDPLTKQTIPRKYFSGGAALEKIGNILEFTDQKPRSGKDDAQLSVILKESLKASYLKADNAQLSPQKLRDVIQRRIADLRNLALRFISPNPDDPEIINVGDVHGFNQDLELVFQILNAPESQGKKFEVIVHGDVFDRGKFNPATYNLIRSLKTLSVKNPNIKVIFLLGNHEEMLLRVIYERDPDKPELRNEKIIRQWLEAGGSETLVQLEKGSPRREHSKNTKAFIEEQFNYLLNPEESRLFSLSGVARFIQKNFDFFYIDAYGFIHSHNGTPINEDANPIQTISDYKKLQEKWGQVKNETNEGEIPNKVISSLKSIHDFLWEDQVNEVTNQFLINEEVRRKRLNIFYALLGVMGGYMGHEVHGVRFGKVMDIGKYMFGIDMSGTYDALGSYQVGKRGIVVMSPTRGIYYQPSLETKEQIVSPADFADHLKEDARLLGELKVTDEGIISAKDQAMTAAQIREIKSRMKVGIDEIKELLRIQVSERERRTPHQVAQSKNVNLTVTVNLSGGRQFTIKEQSVVMHDENGKVVPNGTVFMQDIEDIRPAMGYIIHGLNQFPIEMISKLGRPLNFELTFDLTESRVGLAEAFYSYSENPAEQFMKLSILGNPKGDQLKGMREALNHEIFHYLALNAGKDGNPILPIDDYKAIMKEMGFDWFYIDQNNQIKRQEAQDIRSLADINQFIVRPDMFIARKNGIGDNYFIYAPPEKVNYLKDHIAADQRFQFHVYENNDTLTNFFSSPDEVIAHAVSMALGDATMDAINSRDVFTSAQEQRILEILQRNFLRIRVAETDQGAPVDMLLAPARTGDSDDGLAAYYVRGDEPRYVFMTLESALQNDSAMASGLDDLIETKKPASMVSLINQRIAQSALNGTVGPANMVSDSPLGKDNRKMVLDINSSNGQRMFRSEITFDTQGITGLSLKLTDLERRRFDALNAAIKQNIFKTLLLGAKDVFAQQFPGKFPAYFETDRVNTGWSAAFLQGIFAPYMHAGFQVVDPGEDGQFHIQLSPNFWLKVEMTQSLTNLVIALEKSSVPEAPQMPIQKIEVGQVIFSGPADSTLRMDDIKLFDHGYAKDIWMKIGELNIEVDLNKGVFKSFIITGEDIKAAATGEQAKIIAGALVITVNEALKKMGLIKEDLNGMDLPPLIKPESSEPFFKALAQLWGGKFHIDGRAYLTGINMGRVYDSLGIPRPQVFGDSAMITKDDIDILKKSFADHLDEMHRSEEEIFKNFPIQSIRLKQPMYEGVRLRIALEVWGNNSKRLGEITIFVDTKLNKVDLLRIDGDSLNEKAKGTTGEAMFALFLIWVREFMQKSGYDIEMINIPLNADKDKGEKSIEFFNRISNKWNGRQNDFEIFRGQVVFSVLDWRPVYASAGLKFPEDALKDDAMEDAAMIGNNREGDAVGGIDLTASKTPLDIQSSGQGGIQLKMDPARLRELQNAAGFEPVIINIQPVRDLPLFLGIKDTTPSTTAV